MPGQIFRQAGINGNWPPNDAHDFIEKQYQAESRQHLVEMIAPVQCAQSDDLHQGTDYECSGDSQDNTQQERSGPSDKRSRQVGPDHH